MRGGVERIHSSANVIGKFYIFLRNCVFPVKCRAPALRHVVADCRIRPPFICRVLKMCIYARCLIFSTADSHIKFINRINIRKNYSAICDAHMTHDFVFASLISCRNRVFRKFIGKRRLKVPFFIQCQHEKQIRFLRKNRCNRRKNGLRSASETCVKSAAERTEPIAVCKKIDFAAAHFIIKKSFGLFDGQGQKRGL